MKKILILTFAFVLCFALVSCGGNKASNSDTTAPSGTSGSAGSEVTVSLFNATEYDFTSVAISKADKKQWGENLLSGTLKSYTETTIKLKVPTGSDDQTYDVLAKGTNGTSYEFHYLDLSDLTEKGGSISLALTEAGDGFALFNPPYVDPTLTIDATPTKLNYKVGDGFDPTGFSATYTDEAGEAITLTADDVQFIVSGTVELTTGRPFTTAGKKVVVVHYAGLTQEFELTVE